MPVGRSLLVVFLVLVSLAQAEPVDGNDGFPAFEPARHSTCADYFIPLVTVAVGVPAAGAVVIIGADSVVNQRSPVESAKRLKDGVVDALRPHPERRQTVFR